RGRRRSLGSDPARRLLLTWQLQVATSGPSCRLRNASPWGVLERSIAMNMIRRYLPTAARLFLGLTFTVFGLNFFLHFLPMPTPPPRAGAFLGALFASGYLFPLLKGTEVAAGLLLLGGRFVPLALAVLAPVLVNVIGFHLALEPSGLPVPIAMLAAE